MIEKSGLKKSIADTFQNILNWQRYRFYNENSWSYENSQWRISLSLPLNFTKIDYMDTLLKIKAGKQQFFVRPASTVMYQFNSKWNINAYTSYNQNFGDILGIASGYILKTYRNLSNNNAPLTEIKSTNFSTTITFRNPLKIVFFNTGISYKN